MVRWRWLACLFVVALGVAACGGRSRGPHGADGGSSGSNPSEGAMGGFAASGGAGASLGGTAGGGANGGVAGTDPEIEPSCECPAPGVTTWIADEACVFGDDGGCYRSLSRALNGMVAVSGGTWTRGCGRSIIVHAGQPAIQCVYDEDGDYLGARRVNPVSCPGVSVVETSDLAEDCRGEAQCTVGEAPSELPRCTDPDGEFFEPECLEYDESELVRACTLATGRACSPTLKELLYAVGTVPMTEDPFSNLVALVGCGVTLISNRDWGFGHVTQVFDANGQLIGFEGVSDTPFGPCYSNPYRRGGDWSTLCSQGLHTCPIPDDAATTGLACACPCPPAGDAHVEPTSLECAQSAIDWPCSPSLAEELELLDTLGGLVEPRCGVTTTSRSVGTFVTGYRATDQLKVELECTYADNGPLVGVVREESDPPECVGVTAWSATPQFEDDCVHPPPCWRGRTPPPADVPACE